MAFGDGIGQPQRSTADINIVPLVDVILVLLVIFIVTAPLITQAVKVDLPEAESQPAEALVQPVVVTIDAAGALYWDGKSMTLAELEAQARVLAGRPQAELHIEADRAVAYDAVAQVLAAASRAGVGRIGFVTDPGSARPGSIPGLIAERPVSETRAAALPTRVTGRLRPVTRRRDTPGAPPCPGFAALWQLQKL